MDLPDKKTLALHTLKETQDYLGVSRDTDPQQVAKFLALFGLPFAENGKEVPFCDAGIGYAACRALADLTGTPYTAETAVQVFTCLLPTLRTHYFYASPSCGATLANAQMKGMWLDSEDCDQGVSLLPGWLVMYDWDNDGRPDHVGIVTGDEGDIVVDEEFNTSSQSQGNGGTVAVKSRNWNCILGFVKTYE